MVVLPNPHTEIASMWNRYRMHKLIRINISVRAKYAEFIWDPNWTPANSYIIDWQKRLEIRKPQAFPAWFGWSKRDIPTSAEIIHTWMRKMHVGKWYTYSMTGNKRKNLGTTHSYNEATTAMNARGKEVWLDI